VTDGPEIDSPLMMAETTARRNVGRVARGAWFGVCAQSIDKLLPVLVLFYLARTLDAHSFGIYSFVVAYLMFFQVVSDYGIDTVLIRSMSQMPDRRVAILRAGLGLKLLLASASSVLSVLVVGPASGWEVDVGLMAVASLSLPTALGGAYRAYQRSILDIRSVFFIAALRAALYAVSVVVAIRSGAGLYALFAALSVANLSTFFACAYVLRHDVRPGLSLDPVLWRELTKGAFPLIANAFALTVSLRIGQILLMSLRGPIVVGHFGAAARVSEAFAILPDALMVTVYPLMAGLHVSDGERLIRTAERSAKYLVVAVGFLVTISAAAGGEIMRVLFGEAFADAGTLLSILSFMALLGATGTVIVNLLIAVHREANLFRNTASFAVFGTVLSVVLIRSFGEIGAAAGMVATSATSQLMLAYTKETGRYVRPVLGAGFRAAAAACLAAAAGAASASSPLAAVGIALVVYATTLVVLGVVNRDEIEFVRSTFSAARGSIRE